MLAEKCLCVCDRELIHAKENFEELFEQVEYDVLTGKDKSEGNKRCTFVSK